jgi:hypothetical protein
VRRVPSSLDLLRGKDGYKQQNDPHAKLREGR